MVEGITAALNRDRSNMPMMGMMGGRMAAPTAVGDGDHFEIMTFSVDTAQKGAVRILPKTLAGAPKWLNEKPVRRRVFNLNMMPGGMGMMGRGHGMAINNAAMDMSVINEQLNLGEAEIWEINSDMMGHPFHVHGTSFRVLSQDGEMVGYAKTGLKDVVLVNGTAELLVQLNRTADAKHPFMYHCHILEHEDLGMMGQFTVV